MTARVTRFALPALLLILPGCMAERIAMSEGRYYVPTTQPVAGAMITDGARAPITAIVPALLGTHHRPTGAGRVAWDAVQGASQGSVRGSGMASEMGARAGAEAVVRGLFR